MLDDHALLNRTIELAAQARAEGDHPFGALLALDGEIVAEALNRVNSSRDLTAHAETTLVRQLEQQGRLGLLAEGTVYASCEPCPQCVGAMFWAGSRRVVYALSAARLTEMTRSPGRESVGFTITAGQLGRSATPPMHFTGPQYEDEAAVAHVDFWVTL